MECKLSKQHKPTKKKAVLMAKLTVPEELSEHVFMKMKREGKTVFINHVEHRFIGPVHGSNDMWLLKEVDSGPLHKYREGEIFLAIDQHHVMLKSVTKNVLTHIMPKRPRQVYWSGINV